MNDTSSSYVERTGVHSTFSGSVSWRCCWPPSPRGRRPARRPASPPDNGVAGTGGRTAHRHRRHDRRPAPASGGDTGATGVGGITGTAAPGGPAATGGGPEAVRHEDDADEPGAASTSRPTTAPSPPTSTAPRSAARPRTPGPRTPGPTRIGDGTVTPDAGDPGGASAQPVGGLARPSCRRGSGAWAAASGWACANASAYKGISFWVRGSGPLERVLVHRRHGEHVAARRRRTRPAAEPAPARRTPASRPRRRTFRSRRTGPRCRSCGPTSRPGMSGSDRRHPERRQHHRPRVERAAAVRARSLRHGDAAGPYVAVRGRPAHQHRRHLVHPVARRRRARRRPSARPATASPGARRVRLERLREVRMKFERARLLVSLGVVQSLACLTPPGLKPTGTAASAAARSRRRRAPLRR